MSRFNNSVRTVKMVRLADAHSVGELVLLQSLLDGSGIGYVVRHAHIGSLYPGMPGLSSHVLVDEQDRTRAEELLRRLRLDVREVSDDMEGGG